MIPFPAGGPPSHGSWFPSLLWCGASLTSVIALGVGWCPVGPLGCSLSAYSQDVVSFIEIKKCKAEKNKKKTHQGVNSRPCMPLSLSSPCCHQRLLALLLQVLFGLLALLWLWLLGVIVAAIVVIAIWVVVLALVVVVVIIVM
jgi:hypothetical protein